MHAAICGMAGVVEYLVAEGGANPRARNALVHLLNSK